MTAKCEHLVWKPRHAPGEPTCIRCGIVLGTCLECQQMEPVDAGGALRLHSVRPTRMICRGTCSTSKEAA